jgi:hypothetical protein
MSSTRLIFISNDERNELEAFATVTNQLLIQIKTNDDFEFLNVHFDKNTAIELLKHLTAEISLLED